MKRLGMSERQYAAYAGITRGAVSKARLFGRLVLHADGSIDAGRSDQRRATTTDPSQQRGRHPGDVWLGWPARVAALMAAELGVSAHALQTVLETHVRQHLGELADVLPEFR